MSRLRESRQGAIVRILVWGLKCRTRFCSGKEKEFILPQWMMMKGVGKDEWLESRGRYTAR